ncbi:glycosyltransferase family 2 protein [Patescibacteria group bacterium]|nr:glycosyltransferase family 2 protein [Patescibacteria group bacterium]
MKISVVITAHNEERKIEKALKSVLWTDEIILVDGESTDKTVEIAKKYVNRVISIPNDPGIMSMRNKGIKGGSGEWILILDADEIIPENLAKEIGRKINSDESPVAYRFPRKGYFLGKWIKHCGWYPDYQVRLFRKDHGYYKNEHVHEQVTITNGEVGTISIPYEHHSYSDFSEYLYKVHRYIEFEASKLAQMEKPPSLIEYLLIRPVARFLSIYIRRKGVLDGWRGLILSFFAGYHEFMSYFKYKKMGNEQS